MSQERNWTLINALSEAKQFLEKKRIEHPRLNAELLLGKVLDLTRIELYTNFERPLRAEELQVYREFLNRRAGQEPLQYITGETEFMSLPFRVDPRVLVPRPETEILVEEALSLLPENGIAEVLDIGTGSGCIAVSLAYYRPAIRVTAVDVSSEALEVARSNARLHQAEERIRFYQMDLLSEDFLNKVEGPFDLVVSNPPYIRKDEWDELPREVREFEPVTALCDGGDGLLFYRALAGKADALLKKGGRLLVEVGYRQATDVGTILREASFNYHKVVPDLNEIERVIVTARDNDERRSSS